jgi:hypothetical protein
MSRTTWQIIEIIIGLAAFALIITYALNALKW